MDFEQALSDASDNSWNEEASESSPDEDGGACLDNDYYDEEEPTPQKETTLEDPEEAKFQSLLPFKLDADPRLVINVACTEYEVIKKAARKELGWRLKYFWEDHDGALRNNQKGQKLSPLYDVTWHDLSITTDFFSKLYPWQKVSMLPGIC